MSDSPFHWQGKPSIFVRGQDFNGINSARSERASQLEKNPVFLVGSNVYLAIPERSLTVHGKALSKEDREARSA